MTNEELAARIKSGDKTAIAPLWEGLRRLVYLYANRYYSAMYEQCAACGVTIEDLTQEGYFALLDAVNAWTVDSGYKVATFLRLHVKNRFNALCGIRGKRDPLDRSASLDAPLGDDGDGYTLSDTITDPTAAGAFSDAETRVYTAKLREDLNAALDTIAPDRAEAVRGEYFKGITLQQAADAAGTSIEAARQRRVNGLRDLRRGAALTRLKAYRAEVISSAYRGTLSKFRHTFTSSTERAALELIEAGRGYELWR